MDESRTLKRQMLREAVRENVDVIEGRYRFKQAQKKSLLRTVVRVFFFVALPLALGFSSFLIANGTDGWLGRQPYGSEQATSADEQSEPQATESAFAGLGPLDATALRPTDEQVAALTSAPTVDSQAFPLDVRRVIIDPGHGGENIGTVAPSGLVEKEMALDISRRLGELLEGNAFEAVLTREGDEFISLEDRAVFANESRGDLFVSIHLNWLPIREVRGVETYYLGATNDPYLTELAATENRDSGYSLADFRSMLDRVYAGVRQAESERLAATVQRSLYTSLRQVNPQLQDRGVKKAPFIVLVGTEMPAILAEVSCLSNEKEARLLMTPDYRQYIAEALYEGIESYAQQVRGDEQTGS